MTVKVEEVTVAVRCRTNNRITILVTIDRDRNVYSCSRRWKSNGEAVDSTPTTPLPPKRWWGEYIAEVHPQDREALHKFLELS